MNRPDLDGLRECWIDYLDSLSEKVENKPVIDPDVERANRYAEQHPRPLAGGGFKDQLTGYYVDRDNRTMSEMLEEANGEGWNR